jgi:uncharacterized damage-inducible protein DinB
MSEDRDALLEHYRAMHSRLLGAIDGLTDEQLSETTLDGWSVKDHLLHIALWDEIRAAEVTRISAGHESAWRMNPEHEATFSPIGHALRAGLPVAQAKWELSQTEDAFLAAVGAATERGLDGSLYGEAGLRSTHKAQHTGWIERWRRERGY